MRATPPSVEDESTLSIIALLLASESDTRGTVAALARSVEIEYLPGELRQRYDVIIPTNS